MTDPHPKTELIGYASATDIARRLEEGETTSLDVVERLIDRIRTIDAPGTPVHLRAICAVSEDALEEAARLDEERQSGRVRSSLHGVPIVIKDNIEANGLPGLAGSNALRGRFATDSPLVTQLREAGLVVMASTNLSQWANFRSPRSTSGWSATGGLVGNPWKLDRSAGGSSSGSGSALAAGFAPLALGTETDGSIVCPASVNGVVGLKPTVGTFSREGVVPISTSQDSPGPMGRNISDVASLFSILSGRLQPRESGPIRVAVASTWMTGHPGTDQVFATVMSALATQGVQVVHRDVAVPHEQVEADELTVLLAEIYDDLGQYLTRRRGTGVASLADVVSFEREHVESEMPYFGHELFEQALEFGGRANPEYAAARRRNVTWAIEECLNPALEGVDAVIAPAYGPAWKSDLTIGGHAGVVASCATTPAAISGWPILSVPGGFVDGLPVGIAVLGRAKSEETLMRVGSEVQRATPLIEDVRPTWVDATRG